MRSVAALLLTGGPGVGKTAVAKEIGELLRRAGVRHAVIDLDALGEVHPPVEGGTFNSPLVVRNLTAMWPNYLEHQVERVVLARILGHPDELTAIRGALPGAVLTVCRLSASPAAVRRRLAGRERGVKRDFLLRVAPALAANNDMLGVEDFAVVNDEDRSVTDMALDVLALLRWPAPQQPWDEYAPPC